MAFLGTKGPSEMGRSPRSYNYAPRAMRAEAAAAYLGMGKTKFLELVDGGRLPHAVAIDGIRVWDRLDLDEAFEELKLSMSERRNSFDVILGEKR
jgi:predicted DNA-binding transcriptional regulator AlpA